MDKITVGVLTVSDRCDRKEAVDESGPNLVKMIERGIFKGGEVLKAHIVPDCRRDIERVLAEWRDEGVDVILTTGGTGVAERDVTPEATTAVLEKSIPGISQLMFKRSCDVTPLAALSRAVAGVAGKSLIINLPGSKKASQECLEIVAGIIPHAVDLIRGKKSEIERVHAGLSAKSSVLAGGAAGRKRKSPYPCLSVAEGQKIVLERILPMRKEKEVGYEEAHGHVLAEDVVARDHLPPFEASLKDGYAVRSSDKMEAREVMGVSNAGDSLSKVEVLPGCCMRVSTGAAIPAGADAVVMVEDTDVALLSEDQKEEKKIILKKLPRKGQEIREKGSDFRMGEMILKRGTHLDSSGVGLLAAAGVTSVKVHEKPLVAVISTGDELVNPEESLKPGKVRDSNRVTLISLLKEENFDAVDLGIAVDEPDSLRNSLEKGFRRADVVVTTGSMSMGERDYLKEVLIADFGAEICFGRVHMKPGKPTSFGILTFGGKPKLWFGLPGNPASAFVTSHLFLLPALRKISGLEKVFPTAVKAEIQEVIPIEDRPQYVRAVIAYDENRDSWSAEVTGEQRSSRLGSCVTANCLILIPDETEFSRRTSPACDAASRADSVTVNSTFKAFLIGKTYT